MKKNIIKIIKKLAKYIPFPVLIFISKYIINFEIKISSFFISTAIHAKHISKKHSFPSIPLQTRFNNTNMLSIIVPTYNRHESLQRLLQSLFKQDLCKNFFEIIVINNNCTDSTHEVCEKFSTLLKNFREVFEPTPGLLAGRNRGIKEACGDILVFCDDDIEPDSGWLSAIFKIMQERPDIMLLGGNNRGGFEIAPPEFVNNLWYTDKRGIRINSHYSLIENIPYGMPAPDHGYVMGCNFTVRREVVERARGFGPDCMPSILWQGDGENRVGEVAQSMGTVWLDPAVSVIHHMPESRLNTAYIKKRNLYFLINNFYVSLRKGNIYVDESEEAKLYLRAVCTLKELQEWLTLPDYWGQEAAPQLDDSQFRKLLQRHGW